MQISALLATRRSSTAASSVHSMPVAKAQSRSESPSLCEAAASDSSSNASDHMSPSSAKIETTSTDSTSLRHQTVLEQTPRKFQKADSLSDAETIRSIPSVSQSTREQSIRRDSLEIDNKNSPLDQEHPQNTETSDVEEEAVTSLSNAHEASRTLTRGQAIAAHFKGQFVDSDFHQQSELSHHIPSENVYQYTPNDQSAATFPAAPSMTSPDSTDQARTSDWQGSPQISREIIDRNELSPNQFEAEPKD